MKHLLYKLNPPCKKCPYKSGQIQTPIYPCPQCKMNGYRTFEEFRKQLDRKD